MQVPIRRSEKEALTKMDPHITAAKFAELKEKLEKLKKVTRFKWMKEVATQAEHGDFSENAGYQVAKAKLRGINQAILDIELQLKKAIIIEADSNAAFVQLGHTVTVSLEGKEKKYQVLGSTEVDPLKNIISHNSPLGIALLGKKIGDKARVALKDRTIEYTILNIE